jgi:hypothetical protein
MQKKKTLGIEILKNTPRLLSGFNIIFDLGSFNYF